MSIESNVFTTDNRMNGVNVINSRNSRYENYDVDRRYVPEYTENYYRRHPYYHLHRDDNFGVTGATGPTGNPGCTGAPGLHGDTGIMGPTGPPGKSCDGYEKTGPTGPTGPGGTGSTGPTGERGEEGERGEQGENGVMGPTGPEGPTGQNGNLTGNIVLNQGPNIVIGSQDINNYNLTDGYSYYIMKSPDENSVSIGGFMGGINGRLLIIFNDTGVNQTFIQESSNSLVSNRFLLRTPNQVIHDGQTITFLYMAGITINGTPNQNRWVVISLL